jgi:zinc transport system substrate-binding protein
MGWRPLHGGFLSMALALLLAGCSGGDAEHPTDNQTGDRAGSRLPAFAGIPPVAYLVEQIGGQHVKVDVLVQPGQDPHTFEPTPQQVVALSRAAVFFKIDMPFESVLLDKVQRGNRRLVVVDTTEGMRKLKMDASCGEEADEHEHEHHLAEGQPDPHVWLAPALLKIQAALIAASLGRIDPDHDREYRQNLVALDERIDAVDRRIHKMLEPYRGRAFYVFHPGFAYFADAYGLKQKAVEAGGRTPAAKQLRALIQQCHADGVKTIFVQPEFAPQSAQVVAEAIGGSVVPLNGLAKDAVSNLEDIAQKIEQSFQHDVGGATETPSKTY